MISIYTYHKNIFFLLLVKGHSARIFAVETIGMIIKKLIFIRLMVNVLYIPTIIMLDNWSVFECNI